MQIDKDTIHDLSIFNSDESVSIFNYLNQTGTVGGKEILRYLVQTPLHSIKKIKDTQDVIRVLVHTLPSWPTSITNGTIMVVGKYYETQFDPYPQHPTY
jgi:DNA mismatch repair ATPase MutS